jgi:ABC-type sugar transport system, permease component
MMRSRSLALGVRDAVLTAILAAGAVTTVLPFAYMLSTALKGPVYVFEMPPRLIPRSPTLQNFAATFASNDFGKYFLNSALVTTAAVLSILLLASMMASALARPWFKARKALFSLVVFFMTMPTMSLLIPQFVLAHHLGLTDNLPGLVAMDVAQNLPFAIFLLKGFLEDVPRELDEAAQIDGASEWRRYWSIVLPLCKPALATSAIISFLGVWDEFVWASTSISTPARRTLPVAIATFQGVHTTNWGLVFAASLVAVVPVLTLFVLLQKYIVKGMVAGAIKG